MILAEDIIRELSINELHTTGECVVCRAEMSSIDIATQMVRQPAAGTYVCQTCLAHSEPRIRNL